MNNSLTIKNKTNSINFNVVNDYNILSKEYGLIKATVILVNSITNKNKYTHTVTLSVSQIKMLIKFLETIYVEIYNESSYVFESDYNSKFNFEYLKLTITNTTRNIFSLNEMNEQVINNIKPRTTSICQMDSSSDIEFIMSKNKKVKLKIYSWNISSTNSNPNTYLTKLNIETILYFLNYNILINEEKENFLKIKENENNT